MSTEATHQLEAGFLRLEPLDMAVKLRGVMPRLREDIQQHVHLKWQALPGSHCNLPLGCIHRCCCDGGLGRHQLQGRDRVVGCHELVERVRPQGPLRLDLNEELGFTGQLHIAPEPSDSISLQSCKTQSIAVRVCHDVVVS